MSKKQTSGNLPPELELIKKHIGKIVLAAVVFLVATTSVYTVNPEEVGVVVRLGKYDRSTPPGLNFKLPLLETVEKIPVERQLKQEFGFRTTSPGVRSQYATNKETKMESMMLTGDLNMADVEWVVQYRIRDPYLYLFRVRNAEKTLRDMSEATMRKIVGDRTVNEVLTVGRQRVATAVEERLQRLCDEYELGIAIDQVVLQDVNPPDPVKPSFNEVNEAQQQRETKINQAMAEYNRAIPRARGEAQQMMEQAEGYRINRVNTARGEVERFNSVYTEFVRAPEVTRQRLYLETMERIMPKIGNKIITDESGADVLPLLQMQTGGRN